MSQTLQLRYGMNPHQQPAWLSCKDGDLPIEVLNGSPGFINLLDALNAWQLVRELRRAIDLPAAASFKHVSPAGAAVAVPLNDALRRSYFIGDQDLSPLAAAYARARGADRISSFGDWIALSDTVDVSTAQLIQREVSDGIIAPAFQSRALELLRAKKNGSYRIIQIDPDFEPPDIEHREIFGLTLSQKRDTAVSSYADLTNIVTKNQHLPKSAKRDLLIALIALKYTQSNSVCYALDGQVIGIGAGQQSRIHCTRLAGDKADSWSLRQHPSVQSLPFKKSISRTARDNAVDQYLLAQLPSAEERTWLQNFHTPPKQLSLEEKRAWLSNFDNISLGSDAFFHSATVSIARMQAA